MVIEAKTIEAAHDRQEVQQTIDSLTSLLGPEGAVPSLNSIRGVLAHGDQTIMQNPGQAVVLILKGMGQLTSTVLKLAQVVSDQ